MEDKEHLPADREAHGNRLLAFIYTPMIAPNSQRLGQGDIKPLAPADAVETLHGELRDWLRKIVSVPAGRPGVRVPSEGLEEVIVRMTKPGEKPAIYVPGSYGGPRRTLLFQAVKMLIYQSAGRLIACQECGEPILALRKRLFCSRPSSCLQKWHDREKAKQRGRGKPQKGGA